MNYSDIRARARERLSGHWGAAIGIAAVAWLLGGLMVGSSFLPEVTYTYHGEVTSLEDMIAALGTLSSHFGGTFISLNVFATAQLVIGGVIQLGYAKILLKQHNRQDITFADLFSEFERFGQGFAQKFLRSLYSTLWGLLFIIPGIVAQYSYSMTPYIMADHPHLTAREAISASKDMMQGHKWELFVLHLTFIGWSILAALTMNVGNLILNPYKNAAEAAFYREIAGYPRFTVE